ncbi:MAG: ABC transporter permease [Rubrivivax sp.]
MLLGLASRSLRRNLTRTLVVVSTVFVGFVAVALFAGYTKVVFRGITDQAVHGEMLGHLTLSVPGLRLQGRLDPAKYLLAPGVEEQVRRLVSESNAGATVVPRLTVSGLISNGKASTVFIAEGIRPQDMDVLRGPRARASGALDAQRPTGITLSRGLAQILALKTGDSVSLLSTTIEGQANAVDAEVIDTFSTGNAGTNDKAIYMPLDLARQLADSDGRFVRLTVLLPQVSQTMDLQAELGPRLQAAGLALEVENWQVLSSVYRQVKGLFDMIFAFMLAIIVAIVAMSIANSMAMSVIERTREVGTLRAIGMTRERVAGMFVLEAMLMVLAACALGAVAVVGLEALINALDISYRPPNATELVRLRIDIDWVKSAGAAVLMTALGTLAAFLPARRAGKQSIPTALAHV